MKINEIYEKIDRVLDEAEENIHDEGGINDSELENIHKKIENTIEVLSLIEKHGDELYIAQNLGADIK